LVFLKNEKGGWNNPTALSSPILALPWCAFEILCVAAVFPVRKNGKTSDGHVRSTDTLIGLRKETSKKSLQTRIIFDE
jgi:hypothetical protein